MYIIELIVKALKKKKKEIYSFDPLNMPEEEEYENCEHLFMPIDSTGEVLACRNCGLLVKRKDLKNKNFFMKKT